MSIPIKLALLLAASSQALALTLPTVFTDHMVLQRGQKVPVWGTADPGVGVTVSFAGQIASGTSDSQGKWRVDLAPLKANKQPGELIVKSAGEQTVIKDVLVGEVWFCSGQSNMQWSMRQSGNPDAAIAAANFPLIRLYKTPLVPSNTPLDQINASWQVCSPQTVEHFSAVGYYFGRKLHQELDVPVGLLLSAWGGTRIEPWTPPCGFEGIDAVADIHEMVKRTLPDSPEYQKNMQTYLKDLDAWRDQAGESLSRQVAVTEPPKFPKELILGGNHQTATKLYNGMIHAHVPFAIKGAIWYQGESNYREGALYTEKTKALVRGWRKLWGYDFPYYFVQIAPYKYGNDAPEKLAEFWEAQANIVKTVPRTGMTVVSDYTTLNDIHPPNKLIPGTRLARLALAHDYGKDVVSTGPVFQKMIVQGSSLKLLFDAAKGLKTRDGKTPDWFELAGEDGEYHKAVAQIQGEAVIVKSVEVAKPLAVRFAWHKLATPNLVNEAGIPCATFRAGKLPIPPNSASAHVPEAKEYRVIYQIDLPKDANYAKGGAQYQIDNSTKDKSPFQRVAYYLELESRDGKKQYVFASMNKFTDDLKKLGIPTASSGARFMQKVSGLTIRTNVRGLTPCTNSDGGNIEFWPGNYGPANTTKIPGASDKLYDFGDQSNSQIPGYGSMQIHHWKMKQTAFALNHWGNNGMLDVGIGNASVNNTDWTFSANGGQYKTIRLTVMVK
ncbi:9-O-acetylesterase [Verrucomicrobiaceae bacterium N1E253]|uniref:9-O-acetylesterase n=1 Tax=Oceaniferula marina TaxID=2748318 RepID=A0A851GGA7_9BACT|nr:sialate O-acetylesterase [Oceaniferula marina]NWK54187.1 9-O-acetylesterase [Oceaniferula marina]